MTRPVAEIEIVVKTKSRIRTQSPITGGAEKFARDGDTMRGGVTQKDAPIACVVC